MAIQRNPNYKKFILPEGYVDLGFAFVNPPRVKACWEAKHKLEEFDNSLHLHRCTDVISICHECKIVWHIDMSD
jgi:hypothetical protein